MDIKIPIGVGIRIDDVGWFEGEDQRHMNRPSRSGLPRRHHPDDVRALAEIAKRLGTKIVCDLVLGEWDMHNRLRGVPHVTWDEAGWDAASVVKENRSFFEETFSVLEGSDFIEYGLHGLQHGYYENGRLVRERFLYPHEEVDATTGKRLYHPLPLDEFEQLIQLFLAIYRDWGFKKDIPLFTPGNGLIGQPSDEANLAFARVLRKYGVRVWQWGGWANRMEVHEGLLFPGSVHFMREWNGFDVDADLLPDCFQTKKGYRPVPNPSGHLTNFIRFQHEKNFENVDKWVSYFRRLTSPFGVMLSDGNVSAASQTVYAEYAAVDKVDGGWRIDLSPVDAIRTDAVTDDFFVSIRDKRPPLSCIGGRLHVHECREDHVIYKIVRDGSSVVTLGM